MFVRRTSRKRADGSKASYLQLCHNAWDSSRGRSVTNVLYSFGREDQLDEESVRRLIETLQKMVGRGQYTWNGSGGDQADWHWGMPLGGAWALDGVWRQLGLDDLLGRDATARHDGGGHERTAFALVAKHALASRGERPAHEWVGVEQAIPRVGRVNAAACTQAQHHLAAATREISERLVSEQRLEGATIFLEVVSASHVDAAESGGRAHGRRASGPGAASTPVPAGQPCASVILAVTEDGVPLRYWCSPEDGTGAALGDKIEADVRGWKPARVVWVADSGHLATGTRRRLDRADVSYVLVEDPRDAARGPRAPLSSHDRRRTVEEDVDAKEIAGEGGTHGERRFACRDAWQARIDRAARERILVQLERAVASANALSEAERAEHARRLKASPVFGPFVTATGALLRVDADAVIKDESLDGKVLLRTTDPTLTAQQAGLASARWRDTARSWADMESGLDPRPVCRCCPDSLSAQRTEWWLSLVLTRVAEARTGQAWPQLRGELQRLCVGGFAGAGGTVERHTSVTASQRRILTALGVPEPPESVPVDSLN